MNIPFVWDINYTKSWVIGTDQIPNYLYVLYKQNGLGNQTLTLNIKSNNTVIAKDEIIFIPNQDRYVIKIIQKYTNYNNNTLETTWRDYYPTLLYHYNGEWYNKDVPNDTVAYEPRPFVDTSHSIDRNRPFFIPREQKLQIKDGEFRIDMNNSGIYGVSGATNLECEISNQPATINSNNVLSFSNVQSDDNKTHNTVDHCILNIDWNYTYKQTNNSSLMTFPVGKTEHELYVTYDKPRNISYYNDELFETCVWIGCEAAKGKSTETDVFNAIWNKFQTLNVYSKNGSLLGYYASPFTDQNHNNDIIDIEYLLEHKDGRCGAWAELFQNVLACQGILVDVFKFDLNLSNVISFIQNNNINNPILISLKQYGNDFQGGGSPNNVNFINHAINIYNNKLYDTTRGIGDYSATEIGFLQYLRDNVYIYCCDMYTKEPIYTIYGNEIDLSLFDFERSKLL
ncbi:MAG: hypothetical protein IJS60_10135 [Abditibacteriota bacterium]|nr:hypothetical protein [Abditibacteriota bacterium]